jgi:hypothetical protein
MPEWVRCRDLDTGHEFDLSPEDIRVQDGSVEVLKDYPENKGLTAQARAPKFRVDKAGQPLGAGEQLSADDEAPADEPPAEDTEAVESADTKEK